VRIIPAIDLIGGACVRLTRGSFGTLRKYFDDPVRAAEKWKEEGADWLHIIDLDGARTGKQQNLKWTLEIKQKIDIKIQYGGGIRNHETIRNILDEGIDKVILGTRVIEDEDFLKESISGYKNRVVISLDYGTSGMVFKNGWQKESAISIFELIRKVEQSGANAVIVTDISRDGTLEGVNIEFIKKILESSVMKFIIAGGIGRIEDIINLKEIENMGIEGVIIGKALYEGENRINLREAIRIGAQKDDN
jgi:phosphoribosylformimino-5-aminoimidazole carboxamide ribotide isomerase